MFKATLKKEILEALLSFRFVIATVLCLVLIPLGTYVNLKEYEQRYADYQESVRLYLERSKTRVLTPDFEAESFRPPSMLSIFSIGLDYYLPNRFSTSRSGDTREINDAGINSPESLLFGKVDLLFNVSIVMSLLALVFTFSSISGEKEDGTLKQMLANPVPRWQILSAKIVGNYVVLLVPFLVSILVSLIILNTARAIPVLTPELLAPFLIILLITLLFILAMFNLGIIVSSSVHRSSTSIISLLLLWTFVALSVPKMSPMLAEILCPVKSLQLHNLERSLIRQSIDKELDDRSRDLYDRMQVEQGVVGKITSVPGRTEEEKRFHAAYDAAKSLLVEEYQQRLNNELGKHAEEYRNRRRSQSQIAMNLSRLSPVSCYSYVVSEIASTGLSELDNLNDNMKRFQAHVKETLYDNYTSKSYGGKGGSTATIWRFADGFDYRHVEVPQLPYQQRSLGAALQTSSIDILLLFVFNVFFSILAYASFSRYDVR